MKFNKDDLYSLLGSVGFHLLILLVLSLTILSTVVPEEDSGVLVNFGNVDEAAGTFEPLNTGQEPMEETTPPPPPTPAVETAKVAYVNAQTAQANAEARRLEAVALQAELKAKEMELDNALTEAQNAEKIAAAEAKVAEIQAKLEQNKLNWEKEKLEGWNLVSSTTSYLIYENENWVPMGFTYDSYITEEDFETVSDTNAGNVLMKALLLTDEQVERYGQMMQNLTDDEKNNISYEDYVQDCTARRESAVTSFTATRTGFTAQADLEAENLVLFSVPYDDGFTATVNGVPAEVEKVDNGLMAVAAPAGHSEIVFTYHTAGLRQSVAVSAGAIVVYAVWVAVLHRKKRREESSVG